MRLEWLGEGLVVRSGETVAAQWVEKLRFKICKITS
jgi:hypothetical protein